MTHATITSRHALPAAILLVGPPEHRWQPVTATTTTTPHQRSPRPPLHGTRLRLPQWRGTAAERARGKVVASHARLWPFGHPVPRRSAADVSVAARPSAAVLWLWMWHSWALGCVHKPCKVLQQTGARALVPGTASPAVLWVPCLGWRSTSLESLPPAEQKGRGRCRPPRSRGAGWARSTHQIAPAPPPPNAPAASTRPQPC